MAPVAPPITRFLLEATLPISNGAFFRNIAISPDGTRFAYATALGAANAQGQLYVRRLDRLDVQPMRGIPVAAAPFFSPDSRSIGFFVPATSELKKVSVEGGPAITLCKYPGTPRGATWGTTDTIVFATNDAATGLFRVGAAGGEPTMLTKPDPQKGEQDHLFPSMLPGDRAVLFTVSPVGGLVENSLVAVLDLATGQTKTVIRGGSHAIYLDTGHLLDASGGSLLAVRFDPDNLTVSGDPVPVVEHVRTLNSGASQFDVSRTGTLVYISGDADGVASVTRSLVWVDRSGREQKIAAPGRSYAMPRLSPDGKRAALDLRDQANDIWIWEFERETLTKLTSNPGSDAWPIWTPDGTHIVFASTRDGLGPNLFWQRADFTGDAERLTTNANPVNPHSFSPDGKNLIVQEQIPSSSINLDIIAMDTLLAGKPSSGKMETRPLIHTTAAEAAGEISPNGRWIAYYSNSSSRNEVYVRAFPNVENGGQWQISTAGGTRPAWSRDGRELFYLDLNGAMTVVPVQITPTFSAGKPTKLFDANWWTAQSGRTYDVSADGKRFFAIKDPSSDGQNTSTQTFTVVLNWMEELKQKLP
jgi:serine/threonine-protein kinase